MEPTKIVKYNIINLDCINHDVVILFTTSEYSKALEYMSSYLVKTYEIDNYLKCYFESSKSVCVFKYGGWYGKVLINKIQILEFTDIVL